MYSVAGSAGALSLRASGRVAARGLRRFFAPPATAERDFRRSERSGRSSVGRGGDRGSPESSIFLSFSYTKQIALSSARISII